MEHTSKEYICSECGYKTQQTTNHYGNTWSFGRYNTCPECPPYKKYPEYGGQTIWNYIGCKHVWESNSEYKNGTVIKCSVCSEERSVALL